MLNDSKKILCLFFTIAFIVISCVYSTLAYAQQNKNSLKLMLQMEEAVLNAAENVNNAVVGISTEKTRQVTSYFRNSGNNILNESFQNLFFAGLAHRQRKQIGLGSGVIINKQGYILTNEHVIAGADKIIVTLVDGREFKAKLKGADYRYDLAVIKIDAQDLSYAPLGDSDFIKTGQWAIAIGNPFFAVSSKNPCVTLGVISASHRSLPGMTSRGRDYLDLFQTDAAINPGNSGGPLVNIRGEVIGINVAISTSSHSNGIDFAIPINDAKFILDNLLKGEEVLKKWIGIEIQDINYVLAEYFDLKKVRGVLILTVSKNSPAIAAGLQTDDIILTFNSKRVKNTLGFMKMISKVKAGEQVKLKILRNSLPRIIKLKLGERPKELNFNKKRSFTTKIQHKPGASLKNSKAKSKTPLKTWRGMKVADITKEFANNFDIETVIGVVVIKVIPNTPAARAGVRVKDIITQINTYEVKTLEDYLYATSKSYEKVLVKTNRAFLMIKKE